MAEIVSYERHTRLVAIVHALDDLRQELDSAGMTSQQAAAYLGCINLHLAQMNGLAGELMAQLQECAELLCPECKGYVGFVSDLSSCCLHCGRRFLSAEEDIAGSTADAQARASALHLAHQGVRLDEDS